MLPLKSVSVDVLKRKLVCEDILFVSFISASGNNNKTKDSQIPFSSLLEQVEPLLMLLITQLVGKGLLILRMSHCHEFTCLGVRIGNQSLFETIF